MKKKTNARRVGSSSSRSIAESSAGTVRVITDNPSAPFKMKPEEIESALVSGQHPDLLKR